MRKIILFHLFFLFSLTLLAQDYPIYNQYFNNPYLINPAFVGNSGYLEVGATHRRQWLGWEDAPVSTVLTLQIPTKKAVNIGFSASSESTAFLKRSSILATFGYKVKLGDDHSLRFGLSGGVGNYFLDPTVLDYGNSDDPAVVTMLGSKYFFDGQFGVAYTLKGLKLGFALPRLFDSKVFEKANLKDVRYAQLQYNLFSGSYKISIPYSGISFEPSVIYRMGESITQKWEGLGTIYFKDLVWIGGSYRQKFGPAFFGGLTIKNFKVGYAYEIPTSAVAQYSSGSHELQLSIRFGKNKNEKPKKSLKEIKAEVAKNEVKKVEPKKEEPKKLIEEPKVEPKEEVIEEPKKPVVPVEEVKKEAPGTEVKIEEKKTTHPLELKDGNYIVVGVFKIVKNAENYKKKLRSTGYTSFIGYSSKTGNFYVYLSNHQYVEDARAERVEVRELDVFNNAWIMTVE